MPPAVRRSGELVERVHPYDHAEPLSVAWLVSGVQANEGIELLREKVDTLIVIANDKLLQVRYKITPGADTNTGGGGVVIVRR